jgi:ribonuclease P protein component
VATFSLTKQAKLIITDEFSSVFNFRKRISTQYLILHYRPSAHGQARLGLVVSKKTAKSAVHRNYMRRVLRELFRLQQHEIGAMDLIIRVQKNFSKADFMQIKQEFDVLMTKLKQRIQPLTANNLDSISAATDQ